MAIKLMCDGCGKVADDPDDFSARGLVPMAIRHYCAKCDLIVENWIADRDELHTDLADRWAAGLAALTGGFFDEHSGFELPDINRGKFEDADKG